MFIKRSRFCRGKQFKGPNHLKLFSTEAETYNIEIAKIKFARNTDPKSCQNDLWEWRLNLENYLQMYAVSDR